jgi:hypothetical protein
MMMADKFTKDEIDSQNWRYSGSRQRPGAVSAIEDEMMILVVVVVAMKSCRAVRAW